MSSIDQTRLLRMHRYWNAANYLTVGQIYLQDNPLLREPLRPEHIKPRLLGHWGTSPALSFIYVHLNRLIIESHADVIYLTGPGHGGPAILANVYLEGTYSEVYPSVSRDGRGMHRLFRQFSTPGGVPSHVSVPTPGSIHEGDDPTDTHARFAATLTTCYAKIRAIQERARRRTGPVGRAQWPMIVLRTPKGWTGPDVVDGLQVEDTFRAHQVPLANVKENSEHRRRLEAWMKSYRPEELFDGEGRPVPTLTALAPKGDRRMGANPHANGGRLLVDLDLPDFTDYAIPVGHPGRELHDSTRQQGKLMLGLFTRTARS